MTKDQLMARDEAVAAFMDAFPCMSLFQLFELVDGLMALGRQAGRNGENLCNLANYEDKSDLIAKRVKTLLKKYELDDVKFKVGGDPRGYCLKIMLPNGRYNSWGGKEEGWGF